MSLNDPLANVLSAIQNAERRGKRTLTTKSNSTLIRTALALIQKAGYIEGFATEQDAKGDLLTITLNGTINGIGVIKPRFRIRKDGYERFERRFLPARGFGMLIVSTNQGLLSHDEAKAQGIGGTLICYCY